MPFLLTENTTGVWGQSPHQNSGVAQRLLGHPCGGSDKGQIIVPHLID